MCESGACAHELARGVLLVDLLGPQGGPYDRKADQWVGHTRPAPELPTP